MLPFSQKLSPLLLLSLCCCLKTERLTYTHPRTNVVRRNADDQSRVFIQEVTNHASYYVTIANEMLCSKGLWFCFFHPLRRNIFYSTHFLDSFYFFHLWLVLIDTSCVMDVTFSHEAKINFELPGVFRLLRSILVHLHGKFGETSVLCSNPWVNSQCKTVIVCAELISTKKLFVATSPSLQGTSILVPRSSLHCT